MLLLHDNKVIQKIPRRCIQSDSSFYVAIGYGISGKIIIFTLSLDGL